MVVVLVVMMLGGRVLGLFTDIAPATHFMRDSFVLASGVAVSAIAFLRWLWVLVPVFLASGVVCAVYPEHALMAFGTSTGASLVIAAVIQWRSA